MEVMTEAVCENEANGISTCLICRKPNVCHHQTVFQMKLRAGGGTSRLRRCVYLVPHLTGNE